VSGAVSKPIWDAGGEGHVALAPDNQVSNKRQRSRHERSTVRSLARCQPDRAIPEKRNRAYSALCKRLLDVRPIGDRLFLAGH
jgi:hypothetical protein